MAMSLNQRQKRNTDGVIGTNFAFEFKLQKINRTVKRFIIKGRRIKTKQVMKNRQIFNCDQKVIYAV